MGCNWNMSNKIFSTDIMTRIFDSIDAQLLYFKQRICVNFGITLSWCPIKIWLVSSNHSMCLSYGTFPPFTCFHFNCHSDKEENTFPDFQSRHGHPMLQTSINEKGAAYQTRTDILLSQSPFVSICCYLTVRFTATYSRFSCKRASKPLRSRL